MKATIIKMILSNDRQRPLCKNCHYRWVVEECSTQADSATKRRVLELYLEGLGFRAIGRILGFSFLTRFVILVKTYLQLKQQNTVKVMEIDEMHSYIGSKKTLAGYGLLLIDTKENLSILTLLHETPMIATDYWRPYEHFVPAEKHIQSKAGTWTVEGYNSLFRHFLARMRRKSKCYSKSKKMLEHSILLLMAKWNGGFSILN